MLLSTSTVAAGTKHLTSSQPVKSRKCCPVPSGTPFHQARATGNYSFRSCRVILGSISQDYANRAKSCQPGKKLPPGRYHICSETRHSLHLLPSDRVDEVAREDALSLREFIGIAMDVTALAFLAVTSCEGSKIRSVSSKIRSVSSLFGRTDQPKSEPPLVATEYD